MKRRSCKATLTGGSANGWSAKVMKSILIVEDDLNTSRFYQSFLLKNEFHVITTINGREALSLAETHLPRLIILDIVMPVMDGMEALSRILRKDRKIPIILNSSYTGYREDFMSWAADAYVTKSTDLTELKNKIQELLKKKKVK